MPDISEILPSDLGKPDPDAPLHILRSVAKNLTERYQGAIKGLVSPREVGDTLWIVFYLVAPALDNYKYRLFSITHKNIKNFYPVTFHDFWDEERDADNDDEFMNCLKEIFHSQSFRNVEGTLLSNLSSVAH